MEGGATVALSDDGGGPAGWAEDGSIVVARFPGGLLRIPPGGGPGTMLVEQGKDFALWSPQVLPGGKAVLFANLQTAVADSSRPEAVTLADHSRKILPVQGSPTSRYVPSFTTTSGHLIYVNRSTLFAIPFDLDKLETRGTAVPVLDDVLVDSLYGNAQFAFSPAPSGHGSLVYRKGGVATVSNAMQWLDPAAPPGHERQPLTSKLGAYAAPKFSPDGRRLAMEVLGAGGSDIWIYELQRDAWIRLTFGGFNTTPIWSPDGRYVVFGADGKNLYWTRADGAGQPRLLIGGRTLSSPISFTPDGKRLGFGDALQTWTAPIDDTGGQLKAGKPEQFLSSKSTDLGPYFSPDGRWAAYSSDESGKDEVYVRASIPAGSAQAGRWQISNNGGSNPFWSANGRDLLYVAGDQMMAVGYTSHHDPTGDTFVPDKPRVWAGKLGAAGVPFSSWDLSPDGKRLAVITPATAPESPKADHEVVLLLNFFDELRRRAPLR